MPPLRTEISEKAKLATSLGRTQEVVVKFLLFATGESSSEVLIHQFILSNQQSLKVFIASHQALLKLFLLRLSQLAQQISLH